MKHSDRIAETGFHYCKMLSINRDYKFVKKFIITYLLTLNKFHYLEKMISANNLLRALCSQAFNELLGILGAAS